MSRKYDQQFVNEYARHMSDQIPARAAVKKRRTKWIVGGGVVLVLAAVAVSTSSHDDKPTPATDAAPGAGSSISQPLTADHGDPDADGHTLTFTGATSDGTPASVTYLGRGAQITQAQDAMMPWAADIAGLNTRCDVLGANVSVQRGDGASDVSCQILWDGEVVAENTSTGAYSIASCTLPAGL